MNDGDVVNEYHTNLDGCGYVVANFNDVNKAERKAEEARKEIEFSIER